MSEITQVGIFHNRFEHRAVPKSLFTGEYRVFREMLRDLRLQKCLTQMKLSSALGMAQSFVSKYEMGERRLDFVEVAALCRQLDITLEDFAKSFTRALEKAGVVQGTKSKRGKSK